MIVLLFGPPGSGKGTQATLIAARYGIPAISTGEMFRAECRAGTAIGRVASAILANGGLVSDDLANRILAARIRRADCGSGFLLDGYPRSMAQAVFLERWLAKLRLPKPVVLHLEVAPEVIIRRLSARRQCPKCSRIYNLISQQPRVRGLCDQDGAKLIRRDDDSEAVIRKRLEAYEKTTGQVRAHYSRCGCHHVAGDRPPEAIFEQIVAILDGVPRSLPTLAGAQAITVQRT